MSIFHFLKKTADILALCLNVVFLWLLHLGNFPACWRPADATQIPKGPPPYTVVNHRPISITPMLSLVSERLVSLCLGLFMELSGVLPVTQFVFRKSRHS